MSQNKDLQDAREKFFDGPASDSQSFHQFLKNQGRPDLIKLDKKDRPKKSTGGRVKMAEGTKEDEKKKQKIQGVIRFSGSDMLDLNPEKFVKNLTRTILDEDKRKRDKNSAGGLIGNQKKLDKNKDGKITGQDFKMLRNKKSKGGRVKLAEGSKKFDPQKALDDHAKVLKEMQEALRQVRALAAPGSRLKTIGGKRIGKSKGGRVKLAKGSPNPALMDATSNRATNGKISRGGGSALRGTKFKGVF